MELMWLVANGDTTNGFSKRGMPESTAGAASMLKYVLAIIWSKYMQLSSISSI